MLQLQLAGVPVVKEISVVLSVPVFITADQNQDATTVTNYPTDLTEPILVKERSNGQLNQDFIDMIQVDFIPNVVRSTRLLYWSWYKEKIWFLGATSANQVLIRYKRSISNPTTVNDSIGVTYGELYLARKIASDCVRNPDHIALAERYLRTIINTATKMSQNLPAKRRPYQRTRNAGGFLW
jgi:hypothetical protein